MAATIATMAEQNRTAAIALLWLVSVCFCARGLLRNGGGTMMFPVCSAWPSFSPFPPWALHWMSMVHVARRESTRAEQVRLGPAPISARKARLADDGDPETPEISANQRDAGFDIPHWPVEGSANLYVEDWRNRTRLYERSRMRMSA